MDKPLRIALIIGVDHYENKLYPNLTGALRDAAKIFGFFNLVLKFESILLTNPSSRNVLDELEKIQNRLNDDSIFFFYFAGHGTVLGGSPSQSLICADATGFVASGATDAGTISPNVIADFVRKSRGDMFFCYDACRTPATADFRGKPLDGGTSSFRDAVAKIERTRNDKKPANCWALSSCGDMQRASDDGIFVNSMIDAMQTCLDSGKGIELGDDFIRLIEEKTPKLPNGVKQRPEANGRPFMLAPPSPKPDVPQKDDSSVTTLEPRDVVSNAPQEKVSPATPDHKEPEETPNPFQNIVAKLTRICKLFSSFRAEKLKGAKHNRKESQFQNADTDEKPSQIAESSRNKWDAEPRYNWEYLAKVLGKEGTAAGERRELVVKGAKYGFCYVPLGRFYMGTQGNENELYHLVSIKNGFWILETPVTQKLWTDVMGTNPSSFCLTGEYAEYVEGKNSSEFPVECVSWKDCQAFIKKLNQLHIAPSDMRFRLPTEAEWEYACRARRSAPYWCGDALNKDCANYAGDRPCVVKSHKANPWGLYDVYGNVDEWCDDIDYNYPDYPKIGVRLIKKIVDWIDDTYYNYFYEIPIRLSVVITSALFTLLWGLNLMLCESAFGIISSSTLYDRYDGPLPAMVICPILGAIIGIPIGLLAIIRPMYRSCLAFIPLWAIAAGCFAWSPYVSVSAKGHYVSQSLFYGFWVALASVLAIGFQSVVFRFFSSCLSFIFRGRNHIRSYKYRVIRGGNWQSPAQDCRSASRKHCKISSRLATVGLRLVLAKERNK